jgi:hypothetical protein
MSSAEVTARAQLILGCGVGAAADRYWRLALRKLREPPGAVEDSADRFASGPH